MKNLSKAALLAASATIASTPGAVCGTPRFDATDPKALIEEIGRAFEEFKATNEQKLSGKIGEDELEAKMAEINSHIDDLSGKLAALQVGGGSDGVSPAAREHAQVFDTWFRRGDRAIDADMRSLEVKAGLTTQSDPDGGYLVPEEMDSTIDRVLASVSTMRQLARVLNIGTDTYKKLVNVGGAEAGWVGEEEARPETDTPTLRELVINVKELYANPAASQTLLDDSRVDIAQWLADEISITFAEKEGEAFVLGDGVKRPRGILAYPTVENDSYAWGSIGFVKTGAAATFHADTPADALIDLYYSLKQGYRNNAVFLTSDPTMGVMRKWKDGEDNYLWAPPTMESKVASILGKPVYTDDFVSAIGANAFPVAFADFKRAYTIVDRFGVRVLRDPYTNKPFVHFYTTKRVGGGITNFEAIKLLKVAT